MSELREEMSMKEMKKVQIIVADAVEQVTAPNGAVVNRLVQPALMFKLPFVPSGLSFHIMILTTGFDMSKPIEFELEVVDEKNNKINEVIKQTVPAMGNTFDNFNFNADLRNVPVMSIGTYKINVKFDGELFSQEFMIDADKVLNLSNE